MKRRCIHIILIGIIVMFTNNINAQDNSVWTAFEADDRLLIGFKNADGKVMIPPKFAGISGGKKFRNIIAVKEFKDGRYDDYYLLKNGKKVGQDSLYIWDAQLACEREGLIRFRDKKTDKVGFFNAEGKVAIPAEYNDAKPFDNGFSIVIKNAEKTCWEGDIYDKENPCEHWQWKGGETLLIDKDNNILVNGSDVEENLDLYSLHLSEKPVNDTLIRSFKSVNDNYYNVIRLEPHFENWLMTTIVSNLTKDNLIKHSFQQVKHFKKPDGFLNSEKTAYINSHFESLKQSLSRLQNPNTDYFVTKGHLFSFDYEDALYEKFFDDCGRADHSRYPQLKLVVNYEGVFKQDQYLFVKTDSGYKLVEVVLGNLEN